MNRTIFLNNNNISYSKDDIFDIIIPPELYWVKIFDIPIDSKKELLKVIPSFFEDYFDTISYKFEYQKIATHKYICFAYIEDNIVQKIKEVGIDFKNIQNIYLAQNELINYFEDGIAYSIDDKIYSKQNNLIVQIPTSLANNLEIKQLSLNNIEFSKYKLYLNQSSKYIDLKTAYILSLIFILFSFVTFVKTININSQLSYYSNSIKELKIKYKMPSSKIQTKAIIGELEQIEIKYKRFIKAFEYILKYKNTINTKLLSIDYSDNFINIVFQNNDKLKLVKYISKKYNIVSSNVVGNRLNIRVKI